MGTSLRTTVYVFNQDFYGNIKIFIYTSVETGSRRLGDSQAINNSGEV